MTVEISEQSRDNKRQSDSAYIFIVILGVAPTPSGQAQLIQLLNGYPMPTLYILTVTTPDISSLFRLAAVVAPRNSAVVRDKSS